MNTCLAGGVFKTFGVIYTNVEEKYNSSAVLLSWIPSTVIALALLLGEVYIFDT